MVLSGSTQLLFAQRLSEILNIPHSIAEVARFPNNELSVRVSSDLKGQSVVLVQSMYPDPDSSLVETLLLADAVERVGVEQLTIVMPWMGYSLQDRVFQPGEACSAAVVGRVMTSPNMRAFIAVDLHHPEIQEYFRVPVINVLPDRSIHHKLKELGVTENEIVIVSPDQGAKARAEAVAQQGGYKSITLDKKRSGLETSVTGDATLVKGKIAVVIDDILNTGSTSKSVATHLREAGAKQIWWIVTHGLFTGKAIDNLEQAGLDAVLISDTTEPDPQRLPTAVPIHRFSVAELVADELRALRVV